MKQLVITREDALTYAVGESINTLCTNLSASGARRVLFTSCEEGAGKSFVVFHTARRLAEMGRRVALVDGDLRRSSLCARHGIYLDGERRGVSHYLAHQAGYKEVVYATSVPGLSLVPVTEPVFDAAHLLGGERLGKLMARLSACHDLVLVDTPPVGLISDALMIAAVCEGAVLVAGDNAVRRRELTVARQQLEDAGARVLGLVINRVPHRKKQYGSYGEER